MMELIEIQGPCIVCGEVVYLDKRPDGPFIHFDCKRKRTRDAMLQKQLDHPFYKRVDDFRDEVKREALVKASTKYPEPFNPGSWSIKQLGKHAMAENYDQGNYIVGLMDAAEELERHAAALQRDKEFYENEANHWRLKAQKLSEELAAITKNIEKGSVIDKRV